MKLSIIIPAYNEEESIEVIIKRCLDARETIINKTNVVDVEIIVVSDGSTDNTVEIAKQYSPEIKLISYEKNKGYGRAIKIGFDNANGDLVSFLDADGTCDPLYFVDMINKLDEENADICIGSRMGPNSRMPNIRRIGNKCFCYIINLIADTNISDAASGMRVIRREKLPRLYPLPDGLHFTPAMSCCAVLDPGLKIVEVGMAYEERLGESKLNVIMDGVRFLKVIISTALTYKPLRIIGTAGILLIIISLLYGMVTFVFFLNNGYIPEGYIYRLIAVMVFGVSGVLLVGIAVLADKATRLFYHRTESKAKIGYIIRWVFSWKRLWYISPLLFLSGIVLNFQTIISWISQRIITIEWQYSIHWSYVIAGGYLVLLGIVGFTFGITDYLFDLIYEKINHDDSERIN